MKWNQLINDLRFGLEHYADPKKGAVRTDFRRDYDRLVFSSPFRRLQNKTQVFPLPGSIFVHNRLTHSLEVSSVGKSMADSISAELQAKYAHEGWNHSLSDIGDIVSAGCLAHDLGNPPFGHSGEKAISAFFSEGEGRKLQPHLTDRQWRDFINFEGNANSFRVLTHQFKGRRPGGFAMTYSMLASIAKYPFDSSLAGKKGKFGFFDSEKGDFIKVADTLGMKRLAAPAGSVAYARHPLVYIVEAADDICYEVMDIEDAHKLKILTSAEVLGLFSGYFDGERRKRIMQAVESVEDPNEKVGYLRSCVIGALVESCAAAFLQHEPEILAGTFSGSLIDHLPPAQKEAYARCTATSWAKIYSAPDVVDIDLAGNRILTFLLEKLTEAVINPDLYYSALLLSQVPSQYDVLAPDLCTRIQAVVDHVSAMTDVYALNLFRKLNGHSLPAV